MEKSYFKNKIKVADLRINNRVKCKISNDNAVYEIVAIDGINAKVMLSGARMGEWIPIEKIKPIPLTEEILVEYGFERCNTDDDPLDPEYHEWYERKFPLIGVMCQSYTKQYIFDTNTDTLQILCLHQLQNLYYSLMGKEL